MTSEEFEHLLAQCQMMLAELLALRTEVEHRSKAEGRKTTRPYANTLVKQAAEFAAHIAGPEALELALLKSPDDEGSDRDPLFVAHHRLNLAEPLIGAGGDDHFLDLRNEVITVFAGDAPRLFKRRLKTKGKGELTRWRAASHQLEALRWEAFLDAAGVPLLERQARFIDAYCVSWDSKRKWEKSCKQLFGEEKVAHELDTARRMGLAAKALGTATPEAPLSTPTWEEAGQLYRDEMREPE